MPFTLTHILAVVPIRAIKPRRMPFAALVIGSMIPDLPMFVPHLLSYETTHSVPGVFTACLPMGVATFFCFELFMKEPLVELLPRRMRQRIPRSSIEPTPLSMPMILWAIFAVILGAFTHLFWDSFTHPGRLGTQLIPLLNRSMNLQGHLLPYYKLFQFSSTIIGLPLLFLLLVLWLRRQRPHPDVSVVSKELVFMTRVASLMLCVVIPLAVAVSYRREPVNIFGLAIRFTGFGLIMLMLLHCAAFAIISRRRSSECVKGAWF